MFFTISVAKLNTFLILNYRITTLESDIFEETLLKLAGIATNPKESFYDGGKMQIRDSRVKFQIRYFGLAENDGEILFVFLKKIDPDCLHMVEMKDDTRCDKFNLSSQILESVLLPQIIKKITAMSTDSNFLALFEKYKELSKKAIQRDKLALYDELNKLDHTAEINSFSTNTFLNQYNLTLYSMLKKNLLDCLLLRSYNEYSIRGEEALALFTKFCDELHLPISDDLRNVKDLAPQGDRVTHLSVARYIGTQHYQFELRKALYQMALVSKLMLPREMQEIIAGYIADSERSTAEYQMKDGYLTVIPGEPSRHLINPKQYEASFFLFFKNKHYDDKLKKFDAPNNFQEIRARVAAADNAYFKILNIYNCGNELWVVTDLFCLPPNDLSTKHQLHSDHFIIEVERQLPVRYFLVSKIYDKRLEQFYPDTKFNDFTVVADRKQISLPDKAQPVLLSERNRSLLVLKRHI